MLIGGSGDLGAVCGMRSLQYRQLPNEHGRAALGETMITINDPAQLFDTRFLAVDLQSLASIESGDD
jgi:hypothetical protein